ncbi:MAG TPA: porin [Burkholderiaceae bacterium]|nr:porin [Burkholderiaceae bacterium]
MRKSLVTLAAVAACSADASAQSSVEVYGKLDLTVGKGIGTTERALQESAPGNSRLGFRGTEDLGDGYAAFFGLEHRMRPDTGTEAVAGRFWQGFSVVGLRTPYGTVTVGRQYTASFSLVENQVDPFAATTVANLRDVGMRPGAAVLGLSGSPSGVGTVSRVRVSDSVRYDAKLGNVNFAASIAESQQEAATATGPDKPWSIAVNYGAGPLFLGIGYEDPQGANDRQWTLAARYKFGPATVSGGYANGRTNNSLDTRGMLLGLSYAIGVGEIKVGHAASRVGSGAAAVRLSRFGLGYSYSLSKRTRLIADVAHERKIATNRAGYDLGIEHNF